MATVIAGERVERIPARLLLGEGSLWAPRLNKWLLVNIHGKHIYTLDTYGSGELRGYAVPEQVGTVVLRAPAAGRSEQALVALKTGLAFVDLETGEVTRLPGAPAEPPRNRWNDGKCSPEGRFWAGTMEDATFSPGVGALYCMDPSAAGTAPPAPRKAFGGVTISNGIAWSGDGRTMYYIDTPRNDVQVRYSSAIWCSFQALYSRRSLHRPPPPLCLPPGIRLRPCHGRAGGGARGLQDRLCQP